MAAFQAVPREYFHYLYSEHRATPGEAYEDTPKPWALGYGSALSDYLGQAYMTQVAKPRPGRRHARDRHRQRLPERAAVAHRQAGLLDRDHRAAGPRGVEDLHPAGLRQRPHPRRRRLLRLAGGAGRVRHHHRDLRRAIRAARAVQADEAGRADDHSRSASRSSAARCSYVYTKDAEGKIHSRRDVGVFFIPMTGAMMKNPPPHGTPVAGRPAADARRGDRRQARHRWTRGRQGDLRVANRRRDERHEPLVRLPGA